MKMSIHYGRLAAIRDAPGDNPWFAARLAGSAVQSRAIASAIMLIVHFLPAVIRTLCVYGVRPG